MENNNKKLFIISGPSAVGKNSVIDGVKKLMPNIEETISCTTREPRPNEINRKHYYFISEQEFEDKIQNDEFLEYFKVHAMYYGTLKSEINRIISKKNIPLAIIDVQGALHVKKNNTNAILIFIKPDSWEVLEQRLKGRNTNPEELKIRLKSAKNELEQAKNYDYQVINSTGKIEQAIKKVTEIIEKEVNSLENSFFSL